MSVTSRRLVSIPLFSDWKMRALENTMGSYTQAFVRKPGIDLLGLAKL